MKKSYSDLCLERASKATPPPTGEDDYLCASCNCLVSVRDGCEWEDGDICDVCCQAFFYEFRTMTVELARRLNKSIETIRIAARFIKLIEPKNEEHKSDKWFNDLADELEAMPEEKK